MQEWWAALSGTLRVLYCIAIPSTLILVLQMLLTMFGGHGDGGVDISDTSGLDMPDSFDMPDASDIPDQFDLDLDHSGDTDLSHDMGDGGNPADFGTLKLLTLQTIVTFLAVFGWVSIICISTGMLVPLGIGIGAVCGFLMMLLVAKLVQMSRRLAENGALNLKNAIGETASVYVTIPPKNGGSGKITMQLQGRFGEFDAVNTGSTPLETGTQVLVTDVVGDTLVVEPAETNA